MANQYNSYYLYQQYENRNNQGWIPVYPNIYSVDADGTKPVSAKTINDTACGYTGETYPHYLTFTAIDSGTFKFVGNSVSYSVDNGSTWTSLASNTSSPTVTAGNTIMWKGNLTPTTANGIGTFASTGRFNVMYNAMSLLYGDGFSGQTSLSGKDYAFKKLFQGNVGLVSAQGLEIPATTLSPGCYTQMFHGCSSLTTPPTTLPAMNVTASSYAEMFSGCTSLVKTPDLPATGLSNNCYDNMFAYCTSLVTAPTTLPATTLANTCYAAMFYGCTSLTSSPELPASTVPGWGYGYMFYGCSSLRWLKCFATSLGGNATTGWVDGVSSSGTFVKAASMSGWGRGVNGIPQNWDVANA